MNIQRTSTIEERFHKFGKLKITAKLNTGIFGKKYVVPGELPNAITPQLIKPKDHSSIFFNFTWTIKSN